MKNYLKWRSDKYFLLLILFFSFHNSFSQAEKEKYVFPIRPGHPNFLTANMGELRPNHFHGGLDVKTDGQVGYPVYATADGYVSRVKVSTFGYGNVVYIRHAGNKVTVYAHLDKFNAPIADYVRKRQYEQQTFEIELYPGPDELKVRQGEIIGLAGNSGGSQGPHLHYELRDTTDRVLNPVLLNFREVTDQIPPVFLKLGIVPLEIVSRINGGFSREEFQVVKSGKLFTIPQRIGATGLIGLELKVQDKKNGTRNSYGVNYMQVWLDGNNIFTYNLSSFTFEKTRYINEHIDYPLFAATGKRLERLYVADGNPLDCYSYASPLKGRIRISDSQVHKVKILIRDEYNNESVLNFSIQGEPLKEVSIPSTTAPNTAPEISLLENTLKISTKAPGAPETVLFVKGKAVPLVPAGFKAGTAVFLYDMRLGVPDSVRCGKSASRLSFIKMVPSNTDQEVVYENIFIRIPARSFADTVYFEVDKGISNGQPYYQIHNTYASLYDSIVLRITPAVPVEDKSKVFVYSGNGSRMLFEGGSWKGNSIEVKTKNLGKFTLAKDTVRPTIRLISNYGNSLRFNISDDLSGIGSFRASLDGYWILMNYDFKRNLLWSERLDKTVPLKGLFRLEVKDNAGNIQEFTIQL